MQVARVFHGLRQDKFIFLSLTLPAAIKSVIPNSRLIGLPLIISQVYKAKKCITTGHWISKWLYNTTKQNDCESATDCRLYITTEKSHESGRDE